MMKTANISWWRLWPVIVILLVAGCMPPPGPDGQPKGGLNSMLKMFAPMIFFFVIMWVLLIRPQRKKQKAHEQMVKELKVGNRVVASGMVATVVTVKENTVMLRTADSKIEVLKHAVTEVFEDKPSGEKDN